MKPNFRSILSFFGDIVETVIIALVIFLVVYIFLVQPHRVSGDSMKPNFLDGELILTDKISYRIDQPKRGDVIVFKAPVDQSKDFIKRIIGLPGEKIEIKAGEIYINDKKLNEPYFSDAKLAETGTHYETTSITVPERHYYVFGDNRLASFDSREWGPLPKENIVGRAWLIYWPINKIKFIRHVQY
jgi:signal peptidase I